MRFDEFKIDETVTRVEFADGSKKYLRTYGKMSNDEIIAYFKKHGKEVTCIQGDCDLNDEYYNETAKMVWGMGKHTARGGTDKLRFRCSSGIRAGRQVSHPSKCVQQYDAAKAQTMKRTRARTAPTQARRQKRTKAINTASTLARKLNNPGKVIRPKPWY